MVAGSGQADSSANFDASFTSAWMPASMASSSAPAARSASSILARSAGIGSRSFQASISSWVREPVSLMPSEWGRVR